MTSYEERREMVAIAQALLLELNKHNKNVYNVINHLMSEADGISHSAMDEISAGMQITKKNIVYGKRRETSNDSATVGTVETQKPRAKGSRACSICRQTGHRSTTCPKR